jgi:phosphoglycolate phosphatase-like HAD superfamily hydrolase
MTNVLSPRDSAVLFDLDGTFADTTPLGRARPDRASARRARLAAGKSPGAFRRIVTEH